MLITRYFARWWEKYLLLYYEYWTDKQKYLYVYQLSIMIHSRGFLGRLRGPLLKTVLPLIKNVIKPLAKSVLIPLGLSAAASAADAGIH